MYHCKICTPQVTRVNRTLDLTCDRGNCPLVSQLCTSCQLAISRVRTSVKSTLKLPQVLAYIIHKLQRQSSLAYHACGKRPRAKQQLPASPNNITSNNHIQLAPACCTNRPPTLTPLLHTPPAPPISQLRRSLKAELGAFYPLLLLRPIENAITPVPPSSTSSSSTPSANPASPTAASDLRTTLHTLDTQLIALGSLKALSGDPQLVVDLFVNYDCDLTAPSLYERTLQVGGCLVLGCTTHTGSLSHEYQT